MPAERLFKISVTSRMNIVSPVLFLLIILIDIFPGGVGQKLMLSNPRRDETVRAGTFKSIEGKIISMIFSTFLVNDELKCLFACLAEPSCQSTNFETKGSPEHVCELSNTNIESRPLCMQSRPGYKHFAAYQTTPVSPDDPCANVTCKNRGTCEPVCNEQGFRCKCGAFNKGQYCEHWTVNISSCKDILSKTSYRTDMAYTYLIDNKQTDIYCHLSSDICGSRGWTLAMKIDGTKPTFIHGSPLWSNKNPYELPAGQTGFDSHETKMASYWAMPFHSLCVGMKVGNDLNWALIPYAASSLYDVIADGRSRSFSIGRNKWLSLIGGPSFQARCNNEGFNVGSVNVQWYYARIGIIGNDQNDCYTPDSVVGFGLPWKVLSCGNNCGLAQPGCDNGEKYIAAFGHILIK